MVCNSKIGLCNYHLFEFGRLFVKKLCESVNFTFVFEQFTQSNFLRKTSLQKVSGLRDSLRVVIMLPESAKCRSLGAAVASIPSGR